MSSAPVTAIQGNSGGRGLRIWYGLCLLLALGTYFYALDSQHIPKNGDEYVYAHITRLTANSGHLLPLQSKQIDLRNTKPPLLFWQGIASTHWATNWHLFTLRYPNVMYTLLTALMVLLLGWTLSGQVETGCLASLVYLSFFNTYRYGRPFLTEAPMTFWTFVLFFAFIYWQPFTLESNVIVPLLMGVGLGVAFLYKSFALLVPVVMAFSWWYLDYRGYKVGTFIKKDAGRIAIMGFTALAVFCIWFLVDPIPGEVLREFVIKENLGRVDPNGVSYLHNLLLGSASIWGMILGYPVNAGLLLFPVVALFWISYKRRKEMGGAEKLLWIWALSLFLSFSLPSLRSSRYLLPGMPSLGVLCALNWERISRKAFIATLVAEAVGLGALAYLCLRLQFNLGGEGLFPATFWMLLVVTAAVILAALFVPKFTRPAVPCAALLAFLCLSAAIRPLDGPLGHYNAETVEAVKGKQVWVPCNFRAVDEGYRLLLPGADVHGYRDDGKVTLDSLDNRYATFAIRQPITATNTGDLRVIGERLELHSRHTSRELRDMLRGNVFNQLFVRESLVEVPGAQPVANPVDDGCR